MTDPAVDLHVDPKGPDVQGVDGLPEPVRQLHAVETAPGPGEEARWEGAVQRHLQQQTQTRTLKHQILVLGVENMTGISFVNVDLCRNHLQQRPQH